MFTFVDDDTFMIASVINIDNGSKQDVSYKSNQCIWYIIMQCIL